MYKDYRNPVEIEINVAGYENTCFACPTIYDFEDDEGTKYYFRLRWGHAILICEDTDETLLSENMNGFDGYCDWDDFVVWARKNGVLIKFY